MRIAQKACGLNFTGVYQREGLYPSEMLRALGMEATEAAGVIEAVGDGITHLKPGDWAAYAANPPGAYADARVMPRAQICTWPEAISF